MMMIRIYADFNATDENGRVVLNTRGSVSDLKKHESEIAEGVRVVLYDPGEFEVQGTLVFDSVWKAIPDFSTKRYLDSGGTTGPRD